MLSRVVARSLRRGGHRLLAARTFGTNAAGELFQIDVHQQARFTERRACSFVDTRCTALRIDGPVERCPNQPTDDKHDAGRKRRQSPLRTPLAGRTRFALDLALEEVPRRFTCGNAHIVLRLEPRLRVGRSFLFESGALLCCGLCALDSLAPLRFDCNLRDFPRFGFGACAGGRLALRFTLGGFAELRFRRGAVVHGDAFAFGRGGRNLGLRAGVCLLFERSLVDGPLLSELGLLLLQCLARTHGFGRLPLRFEPQRDRFSGLAFEGEALLGRGLRLGFGSSTSLRLFERLLLGREARPLLGSGFGLGLLARRHRLGRFGFHVDAPACFELGRSLGGGTLLRGLGELSLGLHARGCVVLFARFGRQAFVRKLLRALLDGKTFLGQPPCFRFCLDAPVGLGFLCKRGRFVRERLLDLACFRFCARTRPGFRGPLGLRALQRFFFERALRVCPLERRFFGDALGFDPAQRRLAQRRLGGSPLPARVHRDSLGSFARLCCCMGLHFRLAARFELGARGILGLDAPAGFQRQRGFGVGPPLSDLCELLFGMRARLRCDNGFGLGTFARGEFWRARASASARCCAMLSAWRSA